MINYPFLNYINEDKSKYVKARDKGFYDPEDLFLIGDSGGFLWNIIPGSKFINTNLFTQVADYFIENKVFTKYKVDSIPYKQFRKREEYRRLKGFSAPCLQLPDGSIKYIRITGAHYNFLNYSRMERLDESTIKLGNINTASKKYSFPKFIDAQFWIWHSMEFAKNNGMHLIIDKTRRGGFSYMMASDTANDINLMPHKSGIHVAFDSAYLTDTGGLSDFSINNLIFYESKTPFKRGIISRDNKDFRLGFKNKDGTEAEESWKSSLLSVSAFNNPNCAIGKDAVKIKVEEISTMSNFDAFMDVTEPALRTGAYTTGMITAWGTATSGNMQMFERNFYDPKSNNFMPFENIFDDNARHEVCGLFKPYCWGLQGEINGELGLDKDGNSNIEVGLKIAEYERNYKKNNAKTYSDYINYLGQYAIYPSESFSSAKENIFSSEELTAFETILRVDNSYKFYVDGMFELDSNNNVIFKSNERLRAEKKKTYDWITGVPRKGNEDPEGCVRIWFHPIKRNEVNENNITIKVIPKGSYSISYDPVGIDKDKNELTDRHSHNSIKVWENPSIHNNFKQKLVAAYYGRPNRLEEADRICYYLAVYYNCLKSTNVEVNRGETVSNFRKWKALSYLGQEPLFVFDTSMKGKFSSNYGYNIGDGHKKLEGLRFLKEMLYEEYGRDEYGNIIYAFQYILDYQTILELRKFSLKGNFDRVSEMIVRAIEYKGIKLKAKDDYMKEVNNKDEVYKKDNPWNRNWF